MFARALRLRWLWYEWNEPCRLWVGLGNPCTKEDIDFFYASTTISMGDGTKTPFWDSHWLLGRKPKDIAPLIFGASKRKNWKVREAMAGNAWIFKIKHNTVVSIDHIREFFMIWTLLNDVQLQEQAEDVIIWKHANDGIYTADTAYRVQFLGMTLSPLDPMVWKDWAPPKVKFFAWIMLQDRIWTADRLERHGWPNYGMCKLCNREQQTGTHLFFKCRYTISLWKSIIEKLGLAYMDTSVWLMDE
ncbi:hypothetical protein ZWY2020_040032 [Hordeum vulgare]|nr:hypothetical protein ZWY2020_040032 [Hordeum vulgare]